MLPGLAKIVLSSIVFAGIISFEYTVSSLLSLFSFECASEVYIAMEDGVPSVS